MLGREGKTLRFDTSMDSLQRTPTVVSVVPTMHLFNKIP